MLFAYDVLMDGLGFHILVFHEDPAGGRGLSF